jgi:hypothetical protein
MPAAMVADAPLPRNRGHGRAPATRPRQEAYRRVHPGPQLPHIGRRIPSPEKRFPSGGGESALETRCPGAPLLGRVGRVSV